MSNIVPFGVLSACHGARQGEIALALAAEFGPVDGDQADDALDTLAMALADARSEEPVGELLQVGERLAPLLGADRSVARTDVADLLLPDVLRTGVGHELALAQAAVEAARRAGIALGVVASRDHVYVAHPQAEGTLVLSPRHEWRTLDASDLDEGDVVWRCSHEVAYLVLGRILQRARQLGLLPTALLASALRLKLPLDRTMVDRLRVEDARIRAQLN